MYSRHSVQKFRWFKNDICSVDAQGTVQQITYLIIQCQQKDNSTESKIRLVTQRARQADFRNVRSESELSLQVSFELLLQLQEVVHDFRHIAVTHASIDSCRSKGASKGAGYV